MRLFLKIQISLQCLLLAKNVSLHIEYMLRQHFLLAPRLA
jgi:hypothetical protein